MDIGIDNNIKNCVIKGVDPSKLILIKDSWAKAENTLIHGNQTVKLDDINDFMPIDETWGKTRNKIIYTTEILHEAGNSRVPLVMCSFKISKPPKSLPSMKI